MVFAINFQDFCTEDSFIPFFQISNMVGYFFSNMYFSILRSGKGSTPEGSQIARDSKESSAYESWC